MGGVKTRKEALRILVLTAILLGATIPAVITNGNQNMYVLINAHIQDASQLAPAVIREKTLNISSDYTFTENVYETINVMADNIVIDGNGYILQGPGTGYGFYLDGRTNVTIKNVLVKGWEYGFYLDHSSNNNLVGNTASNNDYGFYLASFSSNNNLVGNTASNNRKDGFLILFNSCNNNLVGNTASNNDENGFRLHYCCDNNNLVGNTASNNDEDGFHLTQSSYNNLSDNKAQSNLYGFYLYYLSNNNNLTGNTAKYNLRGFYLYRSSYNIIRSNTIITYQSGNEIYQDTDSHDNIIEDNTIINEEMLINLIGNSLFSYEMSKQANTIFLILGSLLAVALIGAVTVHIMREKPPPVKGKLEPKPKKWKPPPMRHLSTPI